MAKPKFESLHNHTVSSDGEQTHEQALTSAEQYGIGVMAFTDHDALPDGQALASLQAYRGPVRWTVGVELTSYVPLEVGGPEEGGMHILGLFVDLENRGLQEFCQAAEHGRRERMRNILEHLHEQGFKVTEAEVEAAATSKNIVLPHIVKATMAHPENRRRLDELRERMRRDAENDAELKKKYDEMMAEGPRAYPYAVVMTGHAYVPFKKLQTPNLLDFDATVKLIRAAGGLAFLAHWYHDERKLSEEALGRVLQRGGLDGMETVKVNVMGERDLTHDIERARAVARRYGVAEVMGSDSHSAADLEAFADSDYASESVGQTARLIERFKPNLRWSNLEK